LDRLELHDSLRVVIPGIFLAYIIDIYFQLDWMTSSGVASLLGAGIFLGLIMSPITFPFHRRWFKKICNDFRYWEKIHHIFINKLRLYGNANNSLQPVWVSKRKVIRCAWGHYSDKYSSPSLSSFRMPKTFAIMHCNLLFVYIMASIVILLNTWLGASDRSIWFELQYFDLLVLSILFVISFIEARDKFVYLLKKELEYWWARDEKAVAKIVYVNTVHRTTIKLSEDSDL